MIKHKFHYVIFGIIILLVILRSVFFENIAYKALYDFDEARYAEIAKNIILTNQWFIPLAGGPDDPQQLNYFTLSDGSTLNPYFWKPPLHPQVIAIFYKIFGINELSVRLPSLIFGIMSLVIIYLISKNIFPKNNFIPLVSIILISSSNNFSFLTSQGIAETMLLFFNLLSIYLTLKNKIILTGFFVSVAFMIKSFATFWIFPLIFLILYQNNKKDFISKIWKLLVIFFLVCLPWHILMYINFGNNFINGYFNANLIQRATGEQQNIAPIYWYLKYGLEYWRYFYFLLVISLIPLLKQIQNHKLYFLIIWVSIIFIPFSLMKSKVWWYVFPMYVPLSIITAWGLNIIFKKSKLLLIPLTLIVFLFNYQSLKYIGQNTNYNLGIKKIGEKYSNIKPLYVYKIPYESPLFYLNSHQISRSINSNSQYIITNIDYYQELPTEIWRVIEREEGYILLKKIIL